MRLHKLLPSFTIVQKAVRSAVIKRKLQFPSLLSLELTNLCNASCIMCPRQQMTRKKSHLDFELFKKIIQDCQGKPLKKINLFWFGESLLYPRLMETLDYLKTNLPSTKVTISTNAGLLSKETAYRIIDKELVNTINFDLDGIRKETAEKIRPGPDFDKVQQNIHGFLKIKQDLNRKLPEVRLTIIEMKDNQSEVSEFCDYWRDKVDHLDVNRYNTWMGKIEDRGIYQTQPGPDKFDFPCEHPWNELTIASDGRASLCCLDFDCQAVVGNANEQTIEQIWTGQEINFYRNKLLQLDYQGILCENCNAYIFQEKSVWRALFLKS